MEIKATDKKFQDSPQAGINCLCSRCLKPILKEPVIRAWPKDIGKNPDSDHEYRFHPECLGVQVSSSFDEEDNNEY